MLSPPGFNLSDTNALARPDAILFNHQHAAKQSQACVENIRQALLSTNKTCKLSSSIALKQMALLIMGTS